MDKEIIEKIKNGTATKEEILFYIQQLNTSLEELTKTIKESLAK